MSRPEITHLDSTEKQAVEHVEQLHLGEDATAATISGQGLLKSRFDDLSILRTLWVFRRAALVTLAVYTGYMCEGFELGAGGSVVANAGFIKEFGTGGSSVRALDPTWLSSWSALLNVGQMLTFTYISWFADRYGRKMSFYLAWVWLVVGCVFLNTAKSPSVWALAKLCNGAGIGILQIVAQVYVMEISPNKIRGFLVIFQAVWSNVGGIVVSVMMQQLNQKHPDNYLLAMRILWAPITFMILCWAFVPESPWFHARRGNKEGAMKSLRQLYGNVEGYDFEEEYQIIARTIEHEREFLAHAPSYMDVFRGTNLRRTLTIMILSACGQLGGLSIISTYSTYFFSLAGLEDPFLGSLILSCVNLLAVLLWAVTSDKLGRRSILLPCQTFLCFVLFTVGGLHWSGATTGNVGAGTALLAICCMWTFTFQVVAMSQYVFSAELPSAILRIRTGPITFLVNSLLGIATCYATPPMLLALDLRTAFVYGALSVPICILMWLYVPETAGRSAAEIDELYEKKVPAWRWRKTVTEVEEQMRAAVQMRAAGEKMIDA